VIFFFCYKFEHTSIVVILTLTEIRDAEGVEWRDVEGIEGVGKGEDIAHYRLWCVVVDIGFAKLSTGRQLYNKT